MFIHCSRTDAVLRFCANFVSIGTNAPPLAEWSREDGLGTVSTAQFLDLPADQSAMVEDFLERTKDELNPVKLAFQRWQLQAQLFKASHVMHW